MDEKLLSPLVSDGIVRGIKISIATFEEVCKYSINDCPISHPSQLTNPFLGLPLEAGKCESCGTAENGNCEGHFGYIELPVPIYHPSHISELKAILSFVCFKCMRIKKGKIKDKGGKSNVSVTLCSHCRDLPAISIKEVKTSDGAICLQLSLPSRTRMRDGFWNFLARFGFRYGDGTCRTLLPLEALNILKEIPEETKKRLSAKGFFAQNGYVLQYLPVPPNCLLVPEISDGKSVMSSDISISLLKRVLNKIELIKRSRSGSPNFESHEVECNDLQLAVAEYMHLRGTTKAPHDITRKFVQGQDAGKNSSKQWLEKIRTLFISKGSGFSSRSVITGDSYTGINQIGLPSEIAKRVTFEERVTAHNLERLQKMVDNRLCVTYKDGNSTYAIAVGSQGHTNLKVGQLINRSIVDGDIVFINRPPSTHKHSLQAFTVYVHDDHTVKINPLVCAPLGADFDGDCIHIFYPQSLSAKAEVMELFSVEQQLLSSHSGQLNFQLVSDSLLSLKVMAATSFLRKETAQQLCMFVSPVLPPPAVFKACNSGSLWTIYQILQCALPLSVDCVGQRHVINQSEILKFEFNRDLLQSSLTDIITSILVAKGPRDALNFFNSLQPLLMEVLYSEGFSISLKDFIVPKSMLREVEDSIQEISSLLRQLRISYDELLELQVEKNLKRIKVPVVACILQLSALGFVIDSKSESSISKVLQQIGFLGLQLFDRGKLYSKALVDDLYSHFASKYSIRDDKPSSEAYGLVKSSLFHGLKPFESFVHSISAREVIIRSSRGLTEPGILFKNLMAILRDVVICYDGTVRNVCSNSIIQFEYELNEGAEPVSVSPAGEPVGVLAATAISTPAYKAVLDSSNSTNSSWEQMKEILLCKANYQNNLIDRRVVLYLNNCCCGKTFCRENAALAVQNCLRSVMLKHCALDFSIEYQKQIGLPNSSGTASGLIGHIHLDMMRLKILNQNTDGILRKCQEVVQGHTRKKGHLSNILRRTFLSSSECCGSQQSNDANLSEFPCLQFSYFAGAVDETLEQGIHIMINTICPILLDTIVKGDPRVDAVNIIWTGPDATSWVSSPGRTLKGELALEVVVQKVAAPKKGDAWRIVLDGCLPVIHLIDTTRSIPYGIQQIKELLGISCAFDQSVQRLSKCIRMVSKGVIMEHLVLVGNNMTCTGNLIGFNTSGFKALFRSLKVQVPFTEATLLTPMKCFERAAEKCHTDALGSVVSSVSWGKHVAVGTGTHFEVIWGQKQQVACNEDVGKDVYDLLAWVREPQEKDLPGACLGSDAEDFFDDFQNDDMPLSPEPNSAYEKPTFEDYIESECRDQSDSRGAWGRKDKPCSDNGNKSSWENVSPTVVESDNWQAWGSKDKTSAENGNKSSREKVSPMAVESDNWQAWGSKAKPSADNGNKSSWEKASPAVIESNSQWGSKERSFADNGNKSSGEKVSPMVAESDNWQGRRNRDQLAPDSSEMPTARSDVWSGWDTAKVQHSNQSTQSRKEYDGFGSFDNDEMQKRPVRKTNKPEVVSSSGWNEPVTGVNDPGSGWKERKGNESSWTAKKPEVESSSGWADNSENKAWSAKSPDSGWKENTGNKSSWTARKPEVESSSGWQKNSQQKAWSAKLPDSDIKESQGNESSWAARKPEAESPVNKAWSAKSPDSGWKENTGNKLSWTARKPEVESSSGWQKNSQQKAWSAKLPDSDIKESQGNESSWTTRKPEAESPVNKAWSAKSPDSGWKENTGNKSSWTARKPEVESSSGWQKNSQQKAWSAKLPDSDIKESQGNESSWTARKPEAESSENKAWSAMSPDSGWKRNGENESSWISKKPGGNTSGQSENVEKDAWSAKSLESGRNQKAENQENLTWTAKKPEVDSLPGGNESEGHAWATRATEAKSSPGWNESGGNPWVAKTPEAGSSTGWGGKGKQGWKSQGWGSSSFNDRRGPKNNSPRPPASGSRPEDRGGWRRAESFTTEEEKILVDIEPIMNSIRKILRDKCSDGDRVSPEDQKFITENVFEFHPDKQSKVADQIDYIMVDKHGSFKETRCFYIVSANGSRSDFSYIKCMENFVKRTYPDHAESFNRKFFRRRRSEPPSNNGGQPAEQLSQPSNNDGQQAEQPEQPSNNNGQQAEQPWNNDGQHS